MGEGFFELAVDAEPFEGGRDDDRGDQVGDEFAEAGGFQVADLGDGLLLDPGRALAGEFLGDGPSATSSKTRSGS
ncbi:hypothetical protein [Streptomyces sp. SID2888]|uniref:hypothetical protein n=1 Tax=Streptomyces sp. SID2888 TaxID=2690256 RepID=UPI00136F3D98|nr:hypothetical protein [Streptomyces sp. SID2888]MYV45437.1 hypothetical protein [Streptomyces sp. SID2888]